MSPGQSWGSDRKVTEKSHDFLLEGWTPNMTRTVRVMDNGTKYQIAPSGYFFKRICVCVIKYRIFF